MSFIIVPDLHKLQKKKKKAHLDSYTLQIHHEQIECLHFYLQIHVKVIYHDSG
jgi:hypothetical protein